MLKKLIKKLFKKECCQKFNSSRQAVINFFSRVLSIANNFLRFPYFSMKSDATPKLLTQRIKQERKEFREKGFTEKLKTILSDTYIPSLKSSVYIAVLVLLVWCIIERIFENLLGIERSFPNITEVHTGIGVVIFALIIFVAESLFDDEAKDKSRVLLKVSYLFPLVMAEIIVFFILLWGRDDGVGEAFMVSVIGICTIASLARIIDVLLSKRKFAKQRFNLLQERLRQSIKTVLDGLLGNKILYSGLKDSHIKLCIPSFLNIHYLEYRLLVGYSKDYYFEAKKNGVITDINFNELNQVSTLTHQVNPNAYLIKGFQDVIDEKDRRLVCVHTDFVDGHPELLKKIETHINKAFIIKHQDSLIPEVNDEISGIKDQLIQAIMNKQHNQIDRLSNLYIRITDEFLEYIEKYGEIPHANIHVTKQELIDKVGQSIGQPISARDVFYQAMESRNARVIQKVFNLASRISVRAVAKDNYNLFRDFISFPKWLYDFAVKENNEQLKASLIRWSWEYLSNVYRAMESQFKKFNINIIQKKYIEKYTARILWHFQSLLREAFDHKDLDSFKKFQQEVKNLFVENVPQQLTFYSEQLQEVNKRYKQMYFGLASWILNKHLVERVNKEDADKDKEFYKSICLFFPSDINDFTTSFLATHNGEAIAFWGWSGWEIKRMGEVYSSHFLDYLKKFYIVHLLFLLKDADRSSVENIRLPDALKTQANSLIEILNQIKTNPDKYTFVIGKIDPTKIDLLEQKFSSIGSTSSE